MITLRRAAEEMVGQHVQVSPTHGTIIGKLVNVGEDCLCIGFKNRDGEPYHVYVNLAQVVTMKVVNAPYAKETTSERD